MKKISFFVFSFLLSFSSYALSPKIMCVGDSITQGIGDTSLFGYRAYLQDELGVGQYTLVGPSASPGQDPIYSVGFAAKWGLTTNDTQKVFQSYLDSFDPPQAPISPSIILIHLGTNDISQKKPFSESIKNIMEMIDAIEVQYKNVETYVALLIPRNDGENLQNTQFNLLLKNQLEKKQKSKKNLHIVDMNTAFKSDTYDLCKKNWIRNCMNDAQHPNKVGYQVMAKQWAACIQNPSSKNCE